MAYYQRWEKDLSGGGRYVNQYWPDSGDNDCFFILAPVVWVVKLVLKGVFSLPVIGIIIGIPLFILAVALLLALGVLLLILLPMLGCWIEILAAFGMDVKHTIKWLYQRLTRNELATA